jgi:hypothetical protein
VAVTARRAASFPGFLFHEHGFDGELAYFHCQHALCVREHVIRLFGKGHAANAGATGRPGLYLDYNFAAEFFGRCYGIIGRGSGAAARNFEPFAARISLP